METSGFQSSAFNFSDLEINSIKVSSFWHSTQSEVDFDNLILASETSSMKKSLGTVTDFSETIKTQFANAHLKYEVENRIKTMNGLKTQNFLQTNLTIENNQENQ